MSDAAEPAPEPVPEHQAAVGAEPAVADARADLGILFVHGIGEQTQGETLAQGSEAVIDWLQAWMRHDTGSVVERAVQPLGAALRPPLLVPGTPAHAEIRVAPPPGQPGPAQRWTFAEAWWGPQVLMPAIGEFTLWLLTRGSWMLMFHLDQWLLARRAPWVQWLFALPVALVWMLASTLVNLLLAGAALLALLPVGPLRKGVVAVLRALASIIGDAYVLIRHPLQRSAFEETTLAALDWLRPRCKRLVVVAHSQGAAVAHGALQRPNAPPVHLFVTLGAGIAKLNALRWFERRSAAERVAALIAVPLLLAGEVVWLRTRQLGMEDDFARWFAPLLLLAAGAVALLTAWRVARQAADWLAGQHADLSLHHTAPGFAWHDFAATHDPVPLGTLERYVPGIAALQGRRVPVLRSVWLDHTHYWQAAASFVPALVRELLHCAGTTFVNLDAVGGRLQRVERRRNVDLHLLRIARKLDALALALPALLGWGALAAAVARARAGVAGAVMPAAPGGVPAAALPEAPLRALDAPLAQAEELLRGIAGLFGAASPAPWAAAAVNGLVALALLAAVLLLWQRLGFELWQVWADNRSQTALQPEPKWTQLPEMRPMVLSAGVTLLMGAGLLAVLLLPITLALGWLVGPSGTLSEVHAYELLGGMVMVLSIGGWVFSKVFNAAEFADDWRGPFMEAWAAREGMAPPQRLQATLLALAQQWAQRWLRPWRKRS